ncbi:hypothetical protein QE152_g38407 [Popillia japonica]|uniref:Peptidase A2 domain-containing protein n=1 Tax=Popillia japonica TaxID=7064 RepID=A0AAW1HWX9_POPJA
MANQAVINIPLPALIDVKNGDIIDNLRLFKESWEGIFDALGRFLAPQTNKRYERAIFNLAKQESDEDIDKYNRLRKLIKNYEYATMQDELLLDKIIVSINDLNISQNLWSDKKITLADAIDSMRLAELSKKQMRNLKEDITELLCWFCALKHEKGQCPAKGQKCHKCGKLNHFAVVCKVKKRSVSNTRGNKREQDVRQIETRQLSDEYIYTISHKSSNLSMNLTFEVDGLYKDINKSSNLSMNLTFEVDGLYKDITCQLDTGATCNVMGIENYRKITTIDKIRKSNIQLKCFGGTVIIPSGEAGGCTQLYS